MSKKPGRINDIDDMRVWVAEHDGRINQLWKEQLSINEKTSTEMSAMKSKISQLDIRMTKLAVYVMFFGIVIGAVASRLVDVAAKSLIMN